jgi:hypothetical protein
VRPTCSIRVVTPGAAGGGTDRAGGDGTNLGCGWLARNAVRLSPQQPTAERCQIRRHRTVTIPALTGLTAADYRTSR